MKYIVLLVSIGTTAHLMCRTLPLPQEYAQKAVFHVHVKQLDAFSCGYNVLFNAANFEHFCGFYNRNYEYQVFQSHVLPYLKAQGYSPSKTSTNAITDHLSQKVLGLQPFYHLHIKGRTIVPLLVDKTRISFPSGTSEREVQRLLKNAVEGRQNDVIKSISYNLSQRTTAIFHFLCYLTSSNGVRHGILISLLQNSTGRALYIFDNLNEPLSKYSEAKRFVDYLSTQFNVSTVSVFVGPKLPEQWSHLV